MVNPPQAQPDFTYITDRLAIGNVASRAVPGWEGIVSLLATTPWDEWYGAPLVDHQIVLDCENKLTYFMLPQASKLSLPGCHLDICDGDQEVDLALYLDSLTRYITQRICCGPVLIHCGAGISRSGAVAVAYFCRYAGMSYSEALSFVKSRRPQVAPADCFAEAIKRWLRLDELTQQGPRITT